MRTKNILEKTLFPILMFNKKLIKTIFKYPIILLFCIVNYLSLTATYSQSQETKKLLAKIEGKWQKDDNGNVTYTKVIENINLPKDSIYNRALAYFNYSFNDGGSLIQDKAKSLIVQKGIYENTFHRVLPAPSLIPVMIEQVDTYYKLQIKIKDNGAQIILILTDYYRAMAGGMNSSTHKKYSISSCFPVNKKGNKKNKFGKAFYESHQRGQQSFIEIENALRKSYTVEDYNKGLNDQEFKKYYGNGNIKMIGFKNKNGNITGVLKHYYKNGQLRGIGNAIDGLVTGEWMYYHENGQLQRTGNYLKNKPSGEWKYYDETGKLIKIENFN
jgi:hypothetical protein